MPLTPFREALQQMTAAAHIPAVSYAYVNPADGINTSLTIGQKSTRIEDSTVDENTRFPASSLSKIVFAYLVLRLVEEGQIDLDEPLHDILPYERFLVNGEYPSKAQALTARHVLSHTTGLPNIGSNLDSDTLRFSDGSELGQGYSYSGEALLYLQKVIEAKTGKSLQLLAKAYVFDPLGMARTTFLLEPQDDKLVSVHTELGKPAPIYTCDPPENAAGSLITTAQDFSKFIAACFNKMEAETLEDEQERIFTQAFEPMSADTFPTCGLGWHLYKNPETEEVIAYQFGENPNTRAFIAINVKEKKGAAFFTNAAHGMSIATQVLGSPDFAPIGNMQALFKEMADNPLSPSYPQSDEAGWKETLAGKIAEDQGEFEEARIHFEAALAEAPEDVAKQQRLAWFNRVHPSPTEAFKPAIETLLGKYKNQYGDAVDVYVREESLIFNQLNHETKLVRISNTDFLPEKDQSQKISLSQGQMRIDFVEGGWPKNLSRVTPQSQYKTAMQGTRASDPHYMQPTDSSKAKERGKHIDTAPKPPWRP